MRGACVDVESRKMANYLKVLSNGFSAGSTVELGELLVAGICRLNLGPDTIRKGHRIF
jgi:hypothetical protein